MKSKFYTQVGHPEGMLLGRRIPTHNRTWTLLASVSQLLFVYASAITTYTSARNNLEGHQLCRNTILDSL